VLTDRRKKQEQDRGTKCIKYNQKRIREEKPEKKMEESNQPNNSIRRLSAHPDWKARQACYILIGRTERHDWKARKACYILTGRPERHALAGQNTPEEDFDEQKVPWALIG